MLIIMSEQIRPILTRAGSPTADVMSICPKKMLNDHPTSLVVRCGQQRRVHSHWLFYVAYYLEVFSSLMYVQELVDQSLSLIILSSPFSSSTTFQSSPNTSAKPNQQCLCNVVKAKLKVELRGIFDIEANTYY